MKLCTDTIRENQLCLTKAQEVKLDLTNLDSQAVEVEFNVPTARVVVQ